jgi:hypothetical protein
MKFGIEGLVSKRRDSAYRANRSFSWIKVKNRTHPATEGLRSRSRNRSAILIFVEASRLIAQYLEPDAQSATRSIHGWRAAIAVFLRLDHQL